MSWRQLTLAGWGRSTRSACLAARPERQGDLRRALAGAGGDGVIAHGAGRSYGDCALATGGRTVMTVRLDRMLAFDDATGVLVAEPGVTFADLLEVFLPRGWLAPVSPGTAFVTLGGALANDVHGKNQETAGSFGDHVLWFDLLLPSGATVRVDPDAEPDLFRATVAGIGLTGLVTALALRLKRVPGNGFALRERRIADLDGFLRAFAERGEDDYSVGWIDGLATGAALGRGILETARPAEARLDGKPVRAKRIPIDFPGVALNSWSVRAFNAWYWRRVPTGGRERMVSAGRFLYPLDALHDWNRIYGKRGFHQFQAVLPLETGEAGLRRLLETVARTGSASFLAVLKAMGRSGRGFLSFPMPGYTLALDFPNKPGAAELLAELERLTLDHGGRIYLAKDSLLSRAGFERMYPQHARFKEVLATVDPDGVMASDMARRLGLREVRP
ncbi:FAD-binding protein [Marinivivus vitaminiproducens]|uniref:FAD-binding protein n=1 Tax=Marinivivus vitaminiproducens TaxID=3035935 RepID=UPI0027A589D5|nr:FAD-binding oxidoreductase [Geminicoccaceae bacterium SCSIO 64248]